MIQYIFRLIATCTDVGNFSKSHLFPSKIMEDVNKKPIPEEWKKYSFLLFIRVESPVERRLITAYYIALLHVMTNKLLDVETAKIISRKSAVLKSFDWLNNPVYELALHILIPEVLLSDFLREKNLSYKDALENEELIEFLSENFLVSKVDVIKRLEASCKCQ